jgi:DNA-binding CsgD family transcriptional regulator
VLHLVLALYIICFSLGLVVIFVSLLAYNRSGSVPFRKVAIIFVGALLLLLDDMAATYNRGFSVGFGDALFWLSLVFTVAGNGLLAWVFPAIACEVTGVEPRPARSAAHGGIVAAAVAAGALKTLLPGPPTLMVNTLAMICFQLYGIWVMLHGFSIIKNIRLRVFTLQIIVFMLASMLLIFLQAGLQFLSATPAVLREFPFAMMAYILGGSILLIVNALKYLFVPEATPSCLLPEEVLKRYGISPRECEIISMMVQGMNNRRIGESLFISALTVKNHIYHIYRKTSVANKVQLINLINSSK